MPRLALIPRIPGSAGPANVRRRLADGLRARGVELVEDLEGPLPDAVLVIGGTRALGPLWKVRRAGVPVVQRLAGLNWIHRRRRTGLRHFLRAEWSNLLLRTIRDRLASAVVYQSRFARGWWERRYGAAPGSGSVIYNGVPLDQFSPHGPETPPADGVRMLIVEANFAGGYESGLEPAFALGRRIHEQGQRQLEVVIAGRASDSIRRHWDRAAGVPHRWLGLIAPEQLPPLHRSAHLLYSADLLPACPNSVIEALACGLPVVAYDTGALPELVDRECGRLAPYGGNPWRLEAPNLDELVHAAREVLADQPHLRSGARRRAEAALGIDAMLDGYLAALGWTLPPP